MTRHGVDRILTYAFELARRRPRKKLTSATKSNGISITMPYWDERFAAMAQRYPEVKTSQYHIDGLTIQVVLNPRRGTFVVPAQPTRLDVVRSYVGLGMEHILTGPDHLLFVLGLLLLLSTRRLLVQAITAFTIGHSITLSVAALELATVPSRPIEVLIAASVLALAVELARDTTAATLIRRSPWLVALGFGLLHGFGFAGALAETGLPPGDIPLALFSFNIGIEIGQLAFVAAVLGAGWLAAHFAPGVAGRLRRPAIYAMGILAAFWCFERTATWLGA
jgi:hydrogenase/urease accessory protein HupE